jgi:hypothetical protein
MTISMLMRRTAAIAAAAITISGAAAGQALASAPSAGVPGHPVQKQAVPVAGAAASAGTVSPDASGGGCSPGGYFASACISISGDWVLPDAYINSLPGGCTGAYLSLYDLNVSASSPVETDWIGCATGHFGPYRYGATPGDAYVSELSYYSDAGYSGFISPISYDY